MAETRDLWRRDFAGTGSDLRSPGEILRGQASLLVGKTDKLIQGRVEDSTDFQSKMLSQRFVLVVPALRNYQYVLFRIEYPVVLYPVTFFDSPAHECEKAANEAEFVRMLSDVFTCAETTRAIRSLMTLAREEQRRVQQMHKRVLAMRRKTAQAKERA